MVLLGGDFRQILPVVPRASKAEIVEATINGSSLWPYVHKFELHKNMRVERLLQAGGPNAAANAQQQQLFADWLKRIGEGTEHVYPVHGDEAILLPPGGLLHNCRG